MTDAATTGAPARLVALLRAHHPALLTACIVLQLGLRNLELVEPLEVVLVALVAVAAATALNALAGRLLRDAAAGAALTSVALFLTLNGGELQRWLAERTGAPLGRFAAAALLWGGLAAALALLWRLVLRHPARVERLTTVLGVMVALLSLNVAVRAADVVWSGAALRPAAEAPPPRPATPPLAVESPATPDIYLIICDAYVRDDVLRERYGHDNAPFLAELEARGFFVARQATSNYAMTFMSLAGTLNMDYVHESTRFGERGLGHRVLRGEYYRAIQRNQVARELQQRGYRYAQVFTHWGGTDRSDVADLGYRLPGWPLGEFANALTNASLLRAFTPRSSAQHEFAFAAAERIAEVEGPTFAFVHVLMPHSPFVYDADGAVVRDPPQLIEFASERRAWADRAGYVGQLRHTNRMLLRTIDAIMARSKVEPIIIVAGDHGSSNSMFDPGRPPRSPPLPEERLKILLAVKAPAAVRAAFYPEISSVNAFRVLLSAQFGADLPRLPDRNLFAYYGREGELEDVTERLRAPTGPATP